MREMAVERRSVVGGEEGEGWEAIIVFLRRW